MGSSLKFKCIIALVILSAALSSCTDDGVTYLDCDGKKINNRDWFDSACKVEFEGREYETAVGNGEHIREKLSSLKSARDFYDLLLPIDGNAESVVQYSGVELPDGRVFIVGGCARDKVLSQTWLYSPATKKVYAGPSMSTARCEVSLLLLGDGRVLILGGKPSAYSGVSAQSEIFDPKRNLIADCGRLAVPRVSPGLVQLRNNMVVIVGGVTTPSFAEGPGHETNKVEILDLEQKRCTAAGEIVYPRYWPVLIPHGDDQVIVVGGMYMLDNVSGDTVWQTERETFPKSGGH